MLSATYCHSLPRLALYLGSLALFTQGGAMAQAQPDLAGCLGQTDSVARLACYDGLAGRKAMTALPASPALPPGSTEATPLAPAAQPAKPQQSESFLARYWELSEADKRGTFNYTAYRANYFLPLREMAKVNRYPHSPTRGVSTTLPSYQHGETKLQLSMRSKMLEDVLLPQADLWAAYTQQSMWQLWNHTESAPFRNTDFQPELLYVVPTPAWLQAWPMGWQWRMTQFGFVHQSNGQSGALSRSWNRVYVAAGAERGSLMASLRYEHRLERGSSQSDDNPDMVDMLGRMEAQLTWSADHASTAVLWRPSLRGRGLIQVDWTYPVFNARPDGLRWYLQAFQGYGETLLDYNFKQTSLGLGLTLSKF
jgi:phospholipase A1